MKFIRVEDDTWVNIENIFYIFVKRKECSSFHGWKAYGETLTGEEIVLSELFETERECIDYIQTHLIN